MIWIIGANISYSTVIFCSSILHDRIAIHTYFLFHFPNVTWKILFNNIRRQNSNHFLNNQLTLVTIYGIESLSAKQQPDKQLIESMIRSMAFWVITPIQNLGLYIKKIKVGKVTFYDNINRIKGQPVSTIIKQIMTAAPNSLDGIIRGRIAHKPVAATLVDAKDDSEAIKLGHMQIERSLNVLRFYQAGIVPTNPFFYGMHIAIEGTALSSSTNFLRIEQTGKQVGYDWTKTGMGSTFFIHKNTLKKMRKFYFNKINEILLKPETTWTPFERSLLTSIEFFGAAMHDLIPRSSFVGFVTSLESLLLRNEAKAPILAERIALVLGTNAGQRERMIGQIKKLYDKRSDIVHEGKDKVTRDDLIQIGKIGFATISKLIPLTSKINDKPELIAKINLTKYSAPRFRV